MPLRRWFVLVELTHPFAYWLSFYSQAASEALGELEDVREQLKAEKFSKTAIQMELDGLHQRHAFMVAKAEKYEIDLKEAKNQVS